MFYPMLDLCVSFDCFFNLFIFLCLGFCFISHFAPLIINAPSPTFHCSLRSFMFCLSLLLSFFFCLILCLWFSFVRSPSRFVTYTRGPFRTCKQALICLNVELLRKRAWWHLVLLRWPWKMILHVRWCVFFICVGSSHKNQMTHWSDGYGVIKMINIT